MKNPVSKSTIETNLEDIQKLLEDKKFGLDASLQTRSALVMFEFILRKLKELENDIKSLVFHDVLIPKK